MIKVHHPEFDQEELIKAAGRVVTLIENNSHIKEASSSAITKELIENNYFIMFKILKITRIRN